MNKIWIAVAIVVLGLLGYYLYSNTQSSPAENAADTSSGMLAEENAIVAMEQRPGTSVIVSSVFLAAPGFLVIHEDVNGAPGAIIGASSVLSVGESKNVSVTLNRATRDGERLHAMLHSDVNADGSFNASTDTPVQSRLGGPISGWFEISSSASDVLPEVSI